jgi:hypothetical protein
MVHRQSVGCAVDVGQEAAEVIAADDVALEPDRRADGEQRPGECRGFGAEALGRPVGVLGLGGVDAEETDPLESPRDAHLDGVAIDHLLDHGVGFEREAGDLGLAEGRPGGTRWHAPGGHDQQAHPAPVHARGVYRPWRSPPVLSARGRQKRSSGADRAKQLLRCAR